MFEGYNELEHLIVDTKLGLQYTTIGKIKSKDTKRMQLFLSKV